MTTITPKVKWNVFRSKIKGLYTSKEVKQLYGLYQDDQFDDLSNPSKLKLYLIPGEPSDNKLKCPPGTILSPKGRCIKIGSATYKKYFGPTNTTDTTIIKNETKPSPTKKVYPRNKSPKLQSDKKSPKIPIKTLSIDTLLMITENMNIRDIMALCSTSKEYVEVCDETFWRKIANKRYGITKLEKYKT